MTDKPNDRNKIRPVNEPAKGSWPVIGTRAHPDDIQRIDRAALHVRMKRSAFMLRATLKEADGILEAAGEAPRAPRKGERRKGDRRDPFGEGQDEDSSKAA